MREAGPGDERRAAGRSRLTPETYEVRADGELLTSEPADVLPLAQRILFSGLLPVNHEDTKVSKGHEEELVVFFVPFVRLRVLRWSTF